MYRVIAEREGKRYGLCKLVDVCWLQRLPALCTWHSGIPTTLILEIQRRVFPVACDGAVINPSDYVWSVDPML